MLYFSGIVAGHSIFLLAAAISCIMCVFSGHLQCHVRHAIVLLWLVTSCCDALTRSQRMDAWVSCHSTVQHYCCAATCMCTTNIYAIKRTTYHVVFSKMTALPAGQHLGDSVLHRVDGRGGQGADEEARVHSQGCAANWCVSQQVATARLLLIRVRMQCACKRLITASTL